MGYLIKCHLCEKKFKWDGGKITHCLHCQEFIGSDRPDDDVVMPAFLSSRTKQNDQLYRSMEQGSERRAELAAQMVDAPVADMAALRITDLHDRQREGDMAAKQADEAFNRIKATTKAPVGFAENGQAYSDGVSSGAITLNGQVIGRAEPRAGARAVERVQRAMGG